MGSGTNGSSDPAVPAWKQESAALSAAWHARVKERQAAQLTQTDPVKVELPGGTPVYAVKANILSLFEAGRIPDAITPFVLELLSAGRDKGEQAVTQLLTSQFDAWVRLMDTVWLACVVAPTYAPDGALSDDAIPMRLVEIEDKIALFNWAQGVPEYLADFRQPRDDARTPPVREGVRAPSGGDVRRGAKNRPAPGVPADAGDVLRGPRGRKPSTADDASAGNDPGVAAEGHDLGPAVGVDVRASGRDRAAAGGRERRNERGGHRGSGTASAARR